MYALCTMLAALRYSKIHDAGGSLDFGNYARIKGQHLDPNLFFLDLEAQQAGLLPMVAISLSTNAQLARQNLFWEPDSFQTNYSKEQIVIFLI